MSRTSRRLFQSLALLLAIGFVQSTATAQGDPPTVTAKELTAAYLKNLNAAVKKYGDSMNPKEMIVTGTVADVVQGTYGKIARIEGEGKTVVSCLLRKEDQDALKKGDKIVIRGKCRGYFKNENLVDFNSGVLVKGAEKPK